MSEGIPRGAAVVFKVKTEGKPRLALLFHALYGASTAWRSQKRLTFYDLKSWYFKDAFVDKVVTQSYHKTWFVERP